MPRPSSPPALIAPLLAVFFALSLQACGSADAPVPPPEPTPSTVAAVGAQSAPTDQAPLDVVPERLALDSVRAWQCGDLRVETRIHDPEHNVLALELPGGIRLLGSAISASGARFSDRGAFDGTETVFWNKGEGALLMLGDSVMDCVASGQRSPWAEAREQGSRLRAVGQEPNWLLTVSPEGRYLSLQLQRMGGAAQRWSVVATDEGRTYVAPDGAARIEVSDRACTDTMSGEAFPVTVTVSLPKETLEGCGRHYAVEP